MPLEVKIPKEIMEYKEKIFFGLSIRQLICVVIATVVCLITYFFVKPFIGNDLAGYLVLVEAMPIMGVGFLRINGFTFEKYVMLILKHMFGNQTRVYKTHLSVDFFDYYSDFGLGVTVSEQLVSKAKEEKFARVRGEATDSQNACSTKSGQKAKLKAIKREIKKIRQR